MSRVTTCQECGAALFGDPNVYCLECVTKRLRREVPPFHFGENGALEADDGGDSAGLLHDSVHEDMSGARPAKGIRVHPSHLPTIVDLLEDEVRDLKAKLSVRGGEWCAENRAAGRGGCDACAWCCKQWRDRAEVAEAEVSRRVNGFARYP